jgi:hypothetical protein
MEPLLIEPTKSTPGITFDKDRNIFEITGNSLPEDVNAFYDPVFDWLKKYVASPNGSTTLVFKLTYFNSASSKILFSLLAMLEPLVDKGYKAQIDWCYMEVDEDTLDAGKEYESLVRVPFNFKKFISF